jgi:hypothetical protein
MSKVLFGFVALFIGFLAGFVIRINNKSEEISYETVEFQPLEIILSPSQNNLVPSGGGSCG